MIRTRAAVCIIALATIIAACGGGNGGGSSLVPPAGPHPVAQNAQVKFTFTVPNRSVSAKRRAETISPSTQSIGVTVNSGTQQIFNATPTTNGCVATQGGTQCTVTIDAAVGNDSFNVSTYSGTNATGAILDNTTFNCTIVQDTTNTLNITLGPVVSTSADSGPGSLRQALTDANPGDTITFLLTAPATIKLTSGPIAFTKNVALSGPSGSASGGRHNAGVSAGSGITIDAVNASRVFTVPSGVGVSISNLTLQNGSASSGNGGAIDDSGTLSLTSATIQNSTATGTGDGGAVAVEAGASVTVTGSTITGNKAYKGGGFWAGNTATTLKISGSTLSSNTTTDSAGDNDGGAIYSNIATTLTNDTVSSNTGSAIAVNGSGSLTISGGTYSGNSSSGGYGGAIYDFGGTSKITGAKFDSNTATESGTAGTAYGGAIYSDYDITIDSSTFSNNTASGAAGGNGYGGAIEFDDGSLTVTNSTFTSNSAGGTNAQIGEGGAIYDKVNSVTVTGSTFTSNTAGGTQQGFGGALALQATVTLDHDTFSNNSAYGSNDGEAFGGAADVVPTGSGESFTNSSFTGNSATGGNTTSGSTGSAYGGALEIDGASPLTLDGDTFSSNSVTAANDAEGGALDEGGAPDDVVGVSMNGGSFDRNTATVGNAGCNAIAEGGGASLSGTVTMSNVTFTNNKAVTSSTTSTGSCIALARPRRSRARFHMIHPQVHGSGLTNQEYALGGAIEFCSCGSTFTFDKGTVSNNSATTDGGGIDLRGGTATITNSTISSNSVTTTPNTDDGGGGIMIADTTATTINTSTIANNTVSGDTTGNDGGGGLMVTPQSSPPPTLLTNDTITGNSAQYGGDIYNESSPITLTNVTLMNGTATAAVGAGGDYYGQGTNTLTIFGDLIAGGTASTQYNIGGDTQNTVITDHGYNIINTGGSSMGGGLSDFDQWGTTLDPLLSALASNGGPTQTMADGATSPGKDLIPLTTCQSHGVTDDQRGNTRGDSSDGKCDSGAYEYP